MSDMLNTATSGLLAFQRALSTTSHNIANVNTEGFSRQRVEFEASAASSYGRSFYGSGVNVDSIERIYDQFLTSELRDTTSAYARLETFGSLSAHIDDVLADPEGGISPVLHDFFVAIQDVADDPASSTARFAMINSGETLASRFQSIDSRFNDLSRNLTIDIRDSVDEINRIVDAIRDINVSLNTNSSARTGQQSSDLLDRRDLLLKDLSELVDVSTINGKNNQLSIYLGQGQTILNGITAFSLSTQPSKADPYKDVIAYDGVITVTDISSHLTGGKLSGLIDFRDDVLEQTRNSLGRTAIAVAEALNEQMRDGMDLNGNLGQNFFSYSNPLVQAFNNNTGTATVSAVVSDVSDLTTDNYELDFDGSNWTLNSNHGTSASVATGASVNLTLEGVTLTILGTGAVAGDSFLVKPTSAGAGSFEVVMNNSHEIAVAAPIRTVASLDNLGSLNVSSGIVTDVTDADLLNTATFTFNSPATTFTSDVDVVVGGTAITAGTAITYADSMLVDANGWQVSLEGVPEAGDIVTVEANTDGIGDNRNALNLANLQTLGVLDGGSASFQEDYGKLVGYAGSRTLTAFIERDAQGSLLTQAQNRQDSKSGVNLDEEAADLIRYQQAYEASAQVISTVQQMFDTLLNSMR